MSQGALDPSTRTRSLTRWARDLSALVSFADEAALPHRFEIDRFRVQVVRQRRAASWAPESVESLDRGEAMERAYWMKYAEVAALVTGRPIDLERVESRMTPFRKHPLDIDQACRKAKGLTSKG